MPDAIIKNQADMDRLFAGVVKRFRSMKMGPLAKSEMKGMEALHALFFARATGPDGKHWAPLAPSTIKRKGHATILVDTTRLRQSLTLPQSAFGIRRVVDEWPRVVLIFGTDAPYSIFHQQGIGQKRRPHVGLTPQHLDGMTKRTASYVVERLKT